MHRVIAAILIGFVIAPPLGPHAAQATCTALERAQGTCATPRTDGTTLDVSDTRTSPGTDRSQIDDRLPNTGDKVQPPAAPFRDRLCERSLTQLRLCPNTNTPADPTEQAPTQPGASPITITELIQFAPSPTPTVGEPANVGVAGMPTNFVATASAHIRTGTLFGVPLTVRFTPSGYDFHYGDGSSARTDTGGQTWASLGQAPFTPTATSHVYAGRGTYLADVDVRYTAEVDLGLGWFPVAGELTTDGPTSEIRIFEAHTALVAHTCAQRPSSPGC